VEEAQFMKNFRVIVPVLVCLVFSFYVIGCGNATGGGGGGGGGGTTFRLADPYIVGAKIFMDTDFSGSWDPGEISSEASNSYGYITFHSLPTVDANILPLPGYPGTHVGVLYEGFVARYFSTLESGALYITPATSLMTRSNGEFRFTADQVAYILSAEAGITIEPSDVIRNPMEGTDNLLAGNVDDSQLGKIRSSICINSFIRIMNSVEAGADTSISFEAFINDATAEGHLQDMGAAARDSLNADLMDSLNTYIQTAAPKAPKLSAADITKSSAAITNRIVEKVLDTAPAYTYDPGEISFNGWTGQLALRFYCQRNKNNSAVNKALKDGSIFDIYGVEVTFDEVNTLEAWKMNSSDSLEAIP
jgi:hypothetical protein